MSTKSPPPFFDSKIAYTSPQPSTDDIAPIGDFFTPADLPIDLCGHLTQCNSPLSKLNGKGMNAFLEDAIKNRVAWNKADHIYVSVLNE